ncbi:hypothetical protein LTR53_001535 [Teratosphaeriaceae sp. CCFEE 6253]|nr:hypothetical protein LTR53_001535 [Teratosphaeriaceae sp. CCFEE 6253]
MDKAHPGAPKPNKLEASRDPGTLSAMRPVVQKMTLATPDLVPIGSAQIKREPRPRVQSGVSGHTPNSHKQHENIDRDSLDKVDARIDPMDNRDGGVKDTMIGERKLAQNFAIAIVDELASNELADDQHTALADVLLDFSRLLSLRARSDAEQNACTFIEQHISGRNIARYARQQMLARLEQRTLDVGAEKTDLGSWTSIIYGLQNLVADTASDIKSLSDRDLKYLEGRNRTNHLRSFLVESEEFHWLLSRVRRLPREMETGQKYGALRRELLDSPLELTKQVSVAIQWDPLSFLKQQYGDADHTSASIGNSIAYNGIGDHIEAVGCKDYIERTWPKYGGTILECVEKVIRVEVEDAAVETKMTTGADPTILELSCRDGRLYAELVGSLVAVIEAIEVLAWMGAACRASSDAESPMYISALLEWTTSSEALITYRMSQLSSPVAVHSKAADIQKQSTAESKPASLTSAPAQETNCWLRLVRNPVIVKGYPISRRYNGEKGLEMEIGLMTTLSKASWATVHGGTLMLKGFCSMLVAVARSDRSIRWHYIAVTVDLEALHGSRHFVGWTDSADVLTGTANANYGIEYSVDNFVKKKFGLEGLTVGFSKILTLTTTLRPGNKVTVLTFAKTDSYIWNMEIAETMRVVFYDTDEKRAWLLDGADALLHMARAYLSSPHAAPAKNRYSANLVECFVHRDISEGRRQTARQLLCNPQNRNICICPAEIPDDNTNGETPAGQDEAADKHLHGEESDRGGQVLADKRRFEDLVTMYYETLIEMQAHQRRTSEPKQWVMPITRHPFAPKLEGFGFADLMELGRIWPRFAKLSDSARSWSRVTHAAEAISILGSGFGNLISARDRCSKCTEIPTGYDFLTTSASILRRIAQYRRGVSYQHLELIKGLYWNRPDDACRPTICRCSSATSPHGIKCGVTVTELADYGSLPLTGKEPLHPSTESVRDGPINGHSAMILLKKQQP